MKDALITVGVVALWLFSLYSIYNIYKMSEQLNFFKMEVHQKFAESIDVQRQYQHLWDHMKWIEQRLPERKRCFISWYGDEFQGKPTSSGVLFDKKQHMVAHKTLPVGTVVWFVYQGMTSYGTVVDKGPFVHPREFDVSEAIALELGIQDKGVVEVEAIIWRTE